MWCLSGAISASAASTTTPDQNLTLSPVKQKISLRAGESYTGSFHLLNAGKSGYDLKVYTGPYSVKSEDYTADFESKKSNTEVSNWVTFSKSSYRLGPNQSVDIDYTIKVPSTARPGGHYGVLFAETLPQNTTNNFGVSSTQRLGMLAFLTVAGNYTSGGDIKSQAIPFFQFKAPLTTLTRAENTGNIDFDAKLNVNVSDFLGNLKYRAEKEYAVLPGTVRAMPMNWDNVPSIGLYKVATTTKFLSTEKTVSSYVLMAPLWFYLAVSILLLITIVYWAMRRRN